MKNRKVLLYEPYYSRKGHFKEFFRVYYRYGERNGFKITGVLGVHKSFSEKVDSHTFTINDNTKLSKILSNFSGFRLLNKITRKEQPTVIHFLDYEINTLVLYLIFNYSVFNKTKLVLNLHSTNYLRFDKNILTSLYAAFSFFSYKILDKLFKAVIVTNGEAITNRFNEFTTLSSTKIKTSSWGSDISYDSSISKKENSFLFIGIIRKDKNIEYMIEELAKLNLDFTLTIAGSLSDYTESEIHAMLKKYRFDIKKIRLEFGFLSERRYQELLASHEYLIIPYKAENKSSSGPLLDAIQTETIPIVSNYGQRGELVSKHQLGYTFEFENLDLGEIVVGLSKHEPSEQYRFTKNLRKVKMTFSWKHIIERLINEENIYSN